MKIRYENTINDIIAFRRHANNAPHVRKTLRIVLIVPAAFFVILGILAAIEEQDAIYVAGGVVIGLAWAGLLWLFIRWRFSASLRRLRRDDSVRNLPCWYELELADGALVERTDCDSHASTLETVTKIVSSDSHTFIYIDSGAAYVIPKRSLPEGEYQEFVGAVRREWEETGTLAWRPAPASISSPEESSYPLTLIAGATPVGRGELGHYQGKLGSKMMRCYACGKPRHRGKFTCRQCGRTWWAPIYV
jgi:YcxB-like protein